MAIDFPLPTGTYKIQLLFWEPYFGLQVAGSVGSRVFNIAVEGQPAVSNLDLIAEHGAGTTNRGVLYSHVVTVSDGNLDIDLTGDDGQRHPRRHRDFLRLIDRRRPVRM